MNNFTLIPSLDGKAVPEQQQVGKKRHFAAMCTDDASNAKRRCMKEQQPLLGASRSAYSGNLASLQSSWYYPLRRRSGAPTATSTFTPFLDEICCLPASIMTVAEIMNNHLSRFDIQYTGIRILTESGPGNLGAKVFVELILNAMKMHMGIFSIHSEGCSGLMRWIKLDKEVLYEIGTQRNNLSTLIESLNFHSSSLHLRYIILDILRSLMFVSGSSEMELKRFASEVMVVSSVLRLLKENISDLFTQQIGLSMLSWAVEEKSSRDALIKEGGIEHLLCGMRTHAWDDTVQCNATATLSWLIHTSKITNPSQLRANGGLAVILDTMKRFLDNPMVFGNSACVLSGVLAHRPLQESIDFLCLETVNLVLLGMKAHKDSPKVHRNGLNLLKFLIADENESDEVVSSLLKNIRIIGNSMKDHPNDTAIQAGACEILALIALQSEEARALIKQSGCIELVVQCQLKHRSHFGAQYNAVRFHSCLLQDQQSEGEIAFGGDRQVLGAMTVGIVLSDLQMED
jgi:hypothetical protein